MWTSMHRPPGKHVGHDRSVVTAGKMLLAKSAFEHLEQTTVNMIQVRFLP